MDNRTIDLHTHSTASDGTLTPTELVMAAADMGLAAIALTDHDTADGVAEAAEAARQIGIELIPGIELSTEYKSVEVHVVGLFIDPANPELVEKTAEFRACRGGRNEKIVELLQKEGFDITMEALIAENPDRVITRANIARFLYSHGCVKSIQEAFDIYLGDDCRCYVSRFKVTPSEAVALIRRAGGIAVLAHPLLYHLDDATLKMLIDDTKAAGLVGIEALYGTYNIDDERRVKQIASENGLLLSGGSDFHGSNKPDIRLGTGLGRMHIPYEVLDALREAARGR